MFFLTSSVGVRSSSGISSETASLGALSPGDSAKTAMKLNSAMRRLAGPGFLKIGVACGLKECAKRLALGCCVFSLVPAGYSGPTSTSGANPPPVPAAVNRTVPPVEPPKTALEFSAQPTPQELFRARVFAEPLVPVGAEPGAAENAALADALLGYAKRVSPDDFSSLTGFLEQHPQHHLPVGVYNGPRLDQLDRSRGGRNQSQQHRRQTGGPDSKQPVLPRPRDAMTQEDPPPSVPNPCGEPGRQMNLVAHVLPSLETVKLNVNATQNNENTGY